MDDVLDTIKGKVTGLPLISEWKHFPKVDHDPKLLAETTIKNYYKFPSDVLKLAPQGRFPVVDFGCKISQGTTAFGGSGSAACTECRIQTAEDWGTLERIDPLEGELGKQLEFIKLVATALPDVPKMMTTFMPTMVARKLSANQFVNQCFESEYRKEIREAVTVISDVVTEFSKACLDAGAEGIFMALQEADVKMRADPAEIVELIKLNNNYSSEIHQAAEFTVLHLHGEEVLFKEAMEYLPTDAVNWHDSHNTPPLENAPFNGGLFGGISPDKLLQGSINDDVHRIAKLREQLPIILAPECVIWQGTQEKYIAEIFQNYK